MTNGWKAGQEREETKNLIFANISVFYGAKGRKNNFLFKEFYHAKKKFWIRKKGIKLNKLA